MISALTQRHGYLLDWPKGEPTRHIQKDDLLLSPALEFVGEVPGSRWEEYDFSSNEPLLGEEVPQIPKPFKYKILCRRSGPRLLLLSLNQTIIETIVEDHLSKVLRPRLRPVSIAVDGLVKALTLRPTRYALSCAYARVPAFGTLLRSVSFFGDDLAEASFFRENVQLMAFFICGLRPTAGSGEILRIGAEGTVSFVFSPNYRRRVNDVEEVFRFLRQEGYLETQILTDI